MGPLPNHDMLNAFQRDGVVVVRGLFDQQQIALLEAGIEQNLNNPSHRAKVASRPDDPGRFFEDFCNWQNIDAYERFIKIVDDGRPELELEQVRKLATGEPYTTAQALLNKLVDAQGYLDTAIQQAIKLAGLPASSDPKITVIQEQNPFRFLGPLGQQSQSDITSLFSSDKIRGLASELAVPRLEYRMELK